MSDSTKTKKKCKNDIINASDATRVILNSEPTMYQNKNLIRWIVGGREEGGVHEVNGGAFWQENSK